jgi:hypothetical protein
VIEIRVTGAPVAAAIRPTAPAIAALARRLDKRLAIRLTEQA